MVVERWKELGLCYITELPDKAILRPIRSLDFLFMSNYVSYDMSFELWSYFTSSQNDLN